MKQMQVYVVFYKPGLIQLMDAETFELYISDSLDYEMIGTTTFFAENEKEALSVFEWIQNNKNL